MTPKTSSKGDNIILRGVSKIMTLSKRTLSRQNALSMVMGVYDPLGLISATLVKGKTLLRRLYNHKVTGGLGTRTLGWTKRRGGPHGSWRWSRHWKSDSQGQSILMMLWEDLAWLASPTLQKKQSVPCCMSCGAGNMDLKPLAY